MYVNTNGSVENYVNYNRTQTDIKSEQKKFEDFAEKATELQNSGAIVGNEKKLVIKGIKDGKEITLKHMWIPRVTAEDLKIGNNMNSRYTYLFNQGLNREQNSISIVPGTTIDLKNGMKLQVTHNSVYVVSDNASYNPVNFQDAREKAVALNHFIRYANGQSGCFGFNDEQRRDVASVLQEMGIDTNKTFIVNGVAFDTKHRETGTLEKVGITNPMYAWLPAQQMREVFERYEMNFDWS